MSRNIADEAAFKWAVDVTSRKGRVSRNIADEAAFKWAVDVTSRKGRVSRNASYGKEIDIEEESRPARDV